MIASSTTVLLIIALGLCGCISAYPYQSETYLVEPWVETDRERVNLSDDVRGVALRPYGSLPDMMAKRDRTRITASKRASLNELLEKLIALYGDNDLNYSGRSVHMRFGAGRR